MIITTAISQEQTLTLVILITLLLILFFVFWMVGIDAIVTDNDIIT